MTLYFGTKRLGPFFTSSPAKSGIAYEDDSQIKRATVSLAYDKAKPRIKMMRQIAGSFAEYEKARLVAKLKTARERKRLTTGKREGRKSYAEINPEMVHIAKGLRRRKPGNSLRPSLQIW